MMTLIFLFRIGLISMDKFLICRKLPEQYGLCCIEMFIYCIILSFLAMENP